MCPVMKTIQFNLGKTMPRVYSYITIAVLLDLVPFVMSSKSVFKLSAICSMKHFDALKTVSVVFNSPWLSKLHSTYNSVTSTVTEVFFCFFRNSDLKMSVICIWKNEKRSCLLRRRKNEKFNSPCQELLTLMTCQKKCKINIYY